MTDIRLRASNDLNEGYQDVVRGLSRMTKHLGTDASDAVAEAAKNFVVVASDLADKINKQSETLAAKAGAEVRQHPLAAAALAAIAGGLLGYAISQPHKPKDQTEPK